MKTYRLVILLIAVVIVLTSCEHNVSMETTVHEDGQLDKVIIFEKEDSSSNILDLTEKKGWAKVVKRKDNQPDTAKDSKYIITFTKSFASAEAANNELAISNDTAFHVTSTFEKKFRGFYTYLYYADTYHAINRMTLPIDNYVIPEDYIFIDRLPAEGKPISKADSLYLTRLNEKLFDIYGLRAIYEEYYSAQIELLKKYKVKSMWMDTLAKHKEDVFSQLASKEDIDDDYLIHVLDSLHFPLPYAEAKKEYKLLSKQIESKTSFISEANEGKYVHRINMPWQVIRSNADSVINNQLLWQPPTLRFLIKDYTMYAEARQLNYWVIILAVAIVGFTTYMFLRKRNS